MRCLFPSEVCLECAILCKCKWQSSLKGYNLSSSCFHENQPTQHKFLAQKDFHCHTTVFNPWTTLSNTIVCKCFKCIEFRSIHPITITSVCGFICVLNRCYSVLSAKLINVPYFLRLICGWLMKICCTYVCTYIGAPMYSTYGCQVHTYIHTYVALIPVQVLYNGLDLLQFLFPVLTYVGMCMHMFV